MAHASQERRPLYAKAVRKSGELYNSTRWRELRAQVLVRDGGRCTRCGAIDALSVHHLVRPMGDEALFFDPFNCVTLCKVCHDRETGKERHR